MNGKSECVEANKEMNLVTPIECTGKFKKGDKVTYVRKAFEYSPLLVGREGIVRECGDFCDGERPYQVVFKGHHDDCIEFFNEAELEHGWLFDVGDRVRSRNKHLYNKEEGVVISIDEDYASPMYTVSFGGTQELPFRGYNLERITEEEESPEQQAFGLIVDFHDQHEVCGRLKVEVDKIAATALEHNDYDTVRRAIDISEKLEERTK